MESFNEIIHGNQPVLVDFYADWCGPCRAMSPAVAALGKDVQGRARVLKINIDKAPGVAQQYGVQAVPTFIVFKNGQPVWRQAGMVDKHTLLQQLLRFA
jgi:thioredoxin 1